MGQTVKGCSKCNFRGYTIIDGEPRTCECLKQYRKQKAYQSIGIPKHLIDKTIHDFYPRQDGDGNTITPAATAMKDRVREVVKEIITKLPANIENGAAIEIKGKNDTLWTGNSVLISGTRRSGKSLLVACLAKEALEAGGSPKIIFWPEVIDACFDLSREDASRYAEMLYIFKTCSPLFIENVDAAYDRKRDPSMRGEDRLGNIPWFVAGRIDALLMATHSRGKLMVFTSSQEPRVLLDNNQYGPVMNDIFLQSAKLNLPSPKDLGESDRLPGEMN